jgi:uncharacterized protein (TIGR02996 family)
MSKPLKPPIPATTELNLLLAVVTNPTDAVAREVYADFLHEQGAERADDETRVRAEAEAIRQKKGPLTFEQARKIRSFDRRAKELRAWRNRESDALKRVLCAALPGRATLTWTGSELELQVDGVTLNVYFCWIHANTRRITCQFQTDHGSTNDFVYGKRGFNVHRMIDEVIKMVDGARAPREEARSYGAARARLNGAIEKLNARFGLPPDVLVEMDVEVDPARETMRLALERSPEQMERLLQVLADNGLLEPERAQAADAAQTE